MKTEPRGYRAAVFIPCINNRCPERMQLRFVDKANRPLDDPFYLCENMGCYYHEHPVYPRDIRSEYVTGDHEKRVRYKSDERVLPGEGLTTI